MNNKKRKFSIPHTYTIIFCIILFMTILTWIVPSGVFDTMETDDGRTVVIPGTYHEVESNPQGIDDFFTSPIKGIIDAAETIAFVLIVGGAFGVINSTGAIGRNRKSYKDIRTEGIVYYSSMYDSVRTWWNYIRYV